ncbi:hypothetical protein Pint_25924 [Pistacia integerrima]|uniref:Uncharacterized protein n=1 Tax=Pistacia integerrima TaxID=434235 RepID=A0ACC0YHL0_9ROSI|nr:hypothetical protein Pint_25924 [Pistacia integerrima]
MNADLENLSRTKRRKLNSKVWKEFTKHKEDGKEWAICKHCERKFHGSSKKGTTHLKNHLERCHRGNRNPGEAAVVETNHLIAPIVVKEKSVTDEELNHLDAARMIIKYGFSSLRSIKADIFHVYKEEKEKLRGYFNKLFRNFRLKFEWGFSDVKGLLLDLNVDKNICSTVEGLLSEIRKSFNYVCEMLSNENKFRIEVNKAKSLAKRVTSEGLPYEADFG